MTAPLLRTLDVHLRGELVGELGRPGSGRLSFSFAPAVVERIPGAILLSASLPVRAGRYPSGECRPFFEGLLPEGSVREQLAREFGISPDNAFGLLAAIGVECAGAAVIVPAGETLGSGAGSGVEWLSDDGLATALAELPARPLGVGGDVRLSLAGVQ